MKRTTSERSGEDRKATVACVTDQFQCERIIRAGRSIANLTDTSLLVINVSPIDSTAQSGEAIEHLFRISQQNDAEMSVFYSEKTLKVLTTLIYKKESCGKCSHRYAPTAELGSVQDVVKAGRRILFHCGRKRGIRPCPAEGWRRNCLKSLKKRMEETS